MIMRMILKKDHVNHSVSKSHLKSLHSLEKNFSIVFSLQVKPFCQWEKLDMTALERRKLFCSVTFHIVAITCVIWSLYVLIDRTYQEIRDGEPLQWPFWTKLIVVAIGFTGGLVFMYIQCKVYVHLCKKWKAYNRIIVVQVKSGPQFWAGKCKLNFFQDAPEGVHKPADGQLNKSSHSSVLPDISSSRRSSSAPLHHHYRTNNEVANSSGSPALTGTSNAVSTRGNSSGNSGGGGVATFTVTTEKTNAETQTALRGVAILENTECQAKAEGANCNESNRDHNTVFFTECECKRKGSSQAPKTSLPTSSSKKPKHSTSTPNISMQTTMSSTSASRISRKEQLTKKSSMTSSSSTVKASENNRPPPVNRNHSFSPSSRRRRSELPGSPDDQPPERLRPKRRNTVVSPIHVIHKKI